MTWSNIPRTLKFFRRFNGFIVLNIAGLALGLASVIYIAVWIGYELSYDRFYPKAGRIYRVESVFDYSGDKTVWTITPAPLAGAIRAEMPEVEDAVTMASGRRDVIKAGEQLIFAENLYYTSNSYFNILSTRVLAGDPAKMLKGPDEIVLSTHAAGILFGKEDPIGKTVLLNNKDLLTVSGVIEETPSNTHLKADYLVSFTVLINNGEEVDTWGRFDFITYILLREKTDAEAFNGKISGYLQTKDKDALATLFINPVTRLYLYRDPGFRSFTYPTAERGPIARVILFGLIGFVLLLIACINFINLSTAFASHRAKEIGIRKVNGAGRAGLVLSLFGESLLQTSVATVTALAIVIALLPLFDRITNAGLTIRDLFSLKNIAIYVVMTFVTGIVAGIYPAFVLASFNPVKVFKPLPGDLGQGAGLRKVLVVIQFSLAIIFIFCILVMNRQVMYMQSLDLGFNKDNVMVISPRINPEKVDAIAEQIEKIPGVKKIALGGNVPVSMGNFNTFNRWDGNVTGKPLMFYMVQVDDRYLDLLGIQLADGKYFNPSSYGAEVIVNEAAVEKMEMDQPVGKSIWLGDTRFTIIGVVRDFHFHKLNEEVRPVFIYKNRDWWIKQIFVRLEPGNHFNVVDRIVETVKDETPGFPVRYFFLDQRVDQYYEDERRLSRLINAATVLSIVISCIGLFSLTAFTIRKKYREIGIRKAYGATSANVMLLLQKDFGLLILASAVPALPAGFYIITRWLNSYAYHISLNPIYFIASFLIILSIATLTLVLNTIRAASLNPADTLRNE